MLNLLLIPIVFCLLGAMCAFVIGYTEYAKHYPDKTRALKMALQMAGTAFIALLVASLLAIWILFRIL